MDVFEVRSKIVMQMSTYGSLKWLYNTSWLTEPIALAMFPKTLTTAFIEPSVSSGAHGFAIFAALHHIKILVDESHRAAGTFANTIMDRAGSVAHLACCVGYFLFE